MIKRLMRLFKKKEQKIVSPYVGLTDAQIIERRRKIAVLMRPLHETHLDIDFKGDK
jgi:hypothetical protein